MTSIHRAGKGMLKFLIILVVIAVLGYVGWVSFSKYQRTGEIDAAAVLNSDDRNAAHDDAKPHIDSAVELSKDAFEKLSALSKETFGDGGYIDQAAAWLDTQRNSPIAQAIADEEAAAESTAPVGETPTEQAPSVDTPIQQNPPSQPAKPQKSAETQRLERIILDAEGDFKSGMQFYQAANPANGGWTSERKRAVKQAHEAFKSVRSKLSSGGQADLYDVVERYGQQPDHNRAVLRSAREMARHNQKLVTTAGKMSSAF